MTATLRYLWIFLIVLAGDNDLMSQLLSGNMTEPASLARVDMAVPDAPAFTILEADQGTLLRPGPVREISVTAVDYYGGQGTGHNAAAIELSPGLLLGDVTLGKYHRNPFLYRARISFASSIDGTVRSGAAGVRFTILDESDLRMDTVLEKELLILGHRMNILTEKCSDSLPDSLIDTDPEEYNRLLRACTDSSESGIRQLLEMRIMSARENARTHLWNRPIAEAGLAVKGRQGDGPDAALYADRFAVWMTGGWPIFGEKGQALIGVRGGLARDSSGNSYHGDVLAAVRCYAGSNQFKGYLEWNIFAGAGRRPQEGIRCGGELRVSNGIWMSADIGYVFEGSGGRMTGNSIAVHVTAQEGR